MFVTNWISTTKIQKISEITNFFRHYFLSRTEVSYNDSIRMITYATKPKEVRDRLKREQTTHLGTDLLENEEEDA